MKINTHTHMHTHTGRVRDRAGLVRFEMASETRADAERVLLASAARAARAGALVGLTTTEPPGQAGSELGPATFDLIPVDDVASVGREEIGTIH